MKTHALILIVLVLCVNASKSQNPQILWWYDVNDRCVGQTAMADLNNNGYKDFVFGCYRNDSMVYALSGADGSLLWQYNTSGWQEGCNDAAPLIYDIDGNGHKDVFIASSCHPVAYLFDGATGAVKWQTNTAGRGSDSPPVIADIDGDGALEIIFGQMGGWVMCLNAHDGQIKWNFAVDTDSWIQTAPTLVDLTGNGKLDFVVATWHFNNDSNKVYAFKGEDQSLLWSLPIQRHTYHGTAVADLNKNGEPELIIGDYSGRLYVINGRTGALLWTYDAGGYIGAPAVVGDITNDGNCEIIFTAGYNVVALKNDGSLLWQYTLPNFQQAFRGVVLSDIDNDGVPDVILGASKGDLIALKGSNGQLMWSLDLAQHYGDTFSISTAPVIGDFNNNGFLDAFVVGGKTRYPNFQNNYGRAYAVQIGSGSGPDWPMFQFDVFRRSSFCLPYSTNVSNKEKKNCKLFNVFPNPATTGQTLQLAFYEAPSSHKVAIYDMTGRRIYENETSASLLNVELNVSPAVYFVKVISKNKSESKKIVIH